MIFLPVIFSCKGDFEDDLEEDFSTQYSYFSDDSESSSPVTKRYQIGDIIEESNLPTVSSPEFFAMKPGYKILGWKFYKNLADNSSTRPNNVEIDEESSVIKKITVTSAPLALSVSAWEAVKYFVSFDANGGSGTMENQELTYDEPKSLTANAFTRENYAFAGWGLHESQSPNYPIYYDGDSVSNLANVEGAIVPLYALWLRSQITLHFDSNANDGVGGTVTGEVSDQTIKFAELPQNLTNDQFGREGHSFQYWTVTIDGIENFYSGRAFRSHYPLFNFKGEKGRN